MVSDVKGLAGFSAFLLEHHLDEVAVEALRISRELEVPMLKYLNMPDDDLMKLIKPGYTELLNGFIHGTTDKLIDKSVESWKANQLPIIERDQIVSEDIPLVSQARKRVFLHFLPRYTTDISEAIGIVREIDEYLVRYATVSYRAYINILQSRIEKQTEELRTSDRLYRQAQAVTKIGNYVWDLRDRSLRWSDQMYNIYEIEPGANVNDGRLRPYNHPDDNAIVDENIGASIKTGKPFSFFYRIILNDKREKVLHARGEIEYDAAGNATKVFGTTQDVTEQKAIEWVLHQKTTELQQSNRSLEEFAFIASHDLKEPLRKISTLTDRLVVLENKNLSDDGKIYLQKVVNSSIRMQQMVDDLLSLAQVTSDRSFQKVNLQHLLAEVLQTFDQKLEETKASVSSSALPEISVVPSQFRRLFQNLLSNSLKFVRGDDTPIVVKIEHEYLNHHAAQEFNIQPADRFLKLTFTDNGIGFDNKFLPKIFSIFQRLHPRAKYEGNGIGLSICKRIVENHAGVMFANGEPDKGATFTVIVPDHTLT